jgi:hypothetical protein
MQRVYPAFLPVRRYLALCLLLVCAWIALAVPPSATARPTDYGFGPQAYKNGYAYGNGVYFAPYVFTVYTQPDETSPVIGEFHWSRKTTGSAINVLLPNGDQRAVSADKTFFCFYPGLDVAMMAVTGDDDKGWAEVIYDQAQHKTGWVKLKDTPKAVASAKNEELAPLDKGEPEYFGVYQTWMEFMKLNAKASGVYWLSGVTEYNRSIRTRDEDTAKIFPITLIRDLKVRFIRGNWMLVEVLDFERNTPIGWVRWRDDDGNLMVFPNISGQHVPIVTTGF